LWGGGGVGVGVGGGGGALCQERMARFDQSNGQYT
jgi:hypothetical protein